MTCYSVGYPYSHVGFDNERVNPCVLDGIISGIDDQKKRIYVTVPTFPGNSGGPLFIWKPPISTNGSVNLGEQIVYLGGIISNYILISSEQNQSSEVLLPPVHLGEVISSDAIIN